MIGSDQMTVLAGARQPRAGPPVHRLPARRPATPSPTSSGSATSHRRPRIDPASVVGRRARARPPRHHGHPSGGLRDRPPAAPAVPGRRAPLGQRLVHVHRRGLSSMGTALAGPVPARLAGPGAARGSAGWSPSSSSPFVRGPRRRLRAARPDLRQRGARVEPARVGHDGVRRRPRPGPQRRAPRRLPADVRLRRRRPGDLLPRSATRSPTTSPGSAAGGGGCCSAWSLRRSGSTT